MRGQRVVCFADEGGSFTECSRVCVALLCYERGSSLDSTPSSLYARLVELLGWRRGELKWRSVKKAARRAGLDAAHVARLVLEHSVCYSIASGHLRHAGDAGGLKKRLFMEAVRGVAGSLAGRIAALVVDANLVDRVVLRAAARLLEAPYARIGDSRVYIGIQMADLAAGACSENMLSGGAACKTGGD